MHHKPSNHIKSLLLPCLTFSVLTGVLSALLITVFKMAVELVVHTSEWIYDGVRSSPVYLPLLVLGAAAIGLAASRILSHSHSCRGGGIPTSVTAVRGMVRFKWIASITLLPASALLTFLCGISLGTEGPCVQMGTAVGDGVVKCIGGKKQNGWRRYIMTGGASAGFSIATASPISAIIFSIEELHKHLSPLLLTVASLSVISAQITTRLLYLLGIGSIGLFDVAELVALEPQQLFVPLLIGLVCGVGSIFFSRIYQLIDRLIRALRKRVPIYVAFPVLFACTALVGFFLAEALGTGHGLTEQLLSSQILWHLLLFIFLIRMLIMMTANTVGVTGGVFLPTLAFGAILGALSAEGLIALGWLEAKHYPLMVVLGMVSFLGATSRIPVTACVFAVEALGGIHNILPIIITTTVALLVVEVSGIEDFTDTVIEARLNSINRGKAPCSVEVPLTVGRDCFAVGKELRDVLWPNACAVLSFDRVDKHRGDALIAEGDVITVHYQTYDPAATVEEFNALVGKQSEQIERMMNPQMPS